MRISLAFGAWLDHEPVWLPPEEADAVLAALRDELPWEQRDIVLLGSRLPPPLLTPGADEGAHPSRGTPPPDTLHPRPPETSRPPPRGNRPPLQPPLANRYRSGDDRMGLHADDEPELGEDPVVAIVSLGTSRRLAVRPRRKGVRERHDVDLGHGSLLIMGGACQRHYVHGVPRQPGLQRERISLTFRRLLQPP